MQSYPQTVISDQELRQVYLFAGLNEHQIKRVKQSMRTIQLEEGDILFEQDQHAQRFFLLKSGYVKLLRLSLEGTEKVFEVISPEQTFAEAIMFMPNSVYPVTAQAIDCSTLLAFENQTFLDILKESTDTCFRLMFHMSRRIRKWVNEVDNLTLQNATYSILFRLIKANLINFNSPFPNKLLRHAYRLNQKPFPVFYMPYHNKVYLL